MERSRIGAAATRDEPRTTNEALLTRVSGALASPLGVLLVIPALTITLGAALAVGGQAALRGSNVSAARERLVDQATLVAGTVKSALADADPMLDRLETRARMHDPSMPVESFAHDLAARMAGHRGVTFVSVSFPDGTFQGAYLDPDHVVRFQDSRIGANGTTVRRYELRGDGTLSLVQTETNDYDPRRRGFYRLAVARGARVWTEPYPFFGTHTTGITRASPVFEADGRTLHAVLTVDFDVDGLSSYLRQNQLPSARALIFDREGTLIATPWSEAELRRLPRIADRALAFRDLDDPVIDAFRRAAQSSDEQGEHARSFRFSAGGVRYLASVAPSSPDASLHWSTAYIVPEAMFLGALHYYETRSILVSAAATLVAFVVAWLFARHITRVKEEVAKARREVTELGSYRLVECLGRGGMGEVWRAKHRLLARDAAIKLIHPRLAKAGDSEAKARFKREAEALASLHSRHTIELFDYGVSEDGTFFFVMELLDGLDFETVVERHGALPAQRVASLLAQACSSLAEAHAAGLVHRDIKPANLFVCRAADELDIVKVLDFGLVGAGYEDGSRSSMPAPTLPTDSNPDVRITRFGTMMGTPGFMSPEQVRGDAVSGTSDLYSLGCVGYFLLSGRFVFDDESPVKILMAHLTDPIPELSRLAPPGTPPELIRIIERCLEKLPKDRPASAADVRAELLAIDFRGRGEFTAEDARAFWSSVPAVGTVPKPPEGEKDFASAKTVFSSPGG